MGPRPPTVASPDSKPDSSIIQRLDSIQKKLDRLEQGQKTFFAETCSNQREQEPVTCPRNNEPRAKTAKNRVVEGRYRVEINDSHRRGPDDALVTLVVWSNFACPFSKQANASIDQLRKQYGNRLRVAFKHNTLPTLFELASQAALAAEAAGLQGKFWEMHDLLFSSNTSYTDDRLSQLASSLNLNLKLFRQDMKNPELAKKIERDRLAAHALGAEGTPSFFINGRYIPGASSLARLSFTVDQALVEARSLLEEGVPKKEIYAITIAGHPDRRAQSR